MNEKIGLGAPVTAILAYVVGYYLYHQFEPFSIPQRGVARHIFSPQTFFLLSTIVIVFIRKLKFSDLGLRRKQWGQQVALGVGLGLAPVPLALVIAGVASALHAIFPFLPRSFFGGTPLPIRYELFSMLIMAPICEELFFRGVLVHALRESYRPLATIIFSALIFMGFHGGFALGPLLLGLITAYVTLRSRTILPCVIFHAVMNAYGPMLTSWFPNFYRYVEFLYPTQ